MPWVRVDDQYPEHPKVEQVGHLAGWLNIVALCYANRNLTDGFIPDAVMPRLSTVPTPRKQAERLVDVGLWERVDGGYVIHDYHAYQMTAENIRHNRAAAAARQAKFRNNGSRNAVTNNVTNASGNGHVTASPLPHPTNPVVQNSSPPLTRPSVTEEEAPRLTKDELRKITSVARAKIKHIDDLEGEPE